MTDQDLVARLRFLASGQDDPHSVAITEACDAIDRLTAEVAELKAYISELSMSLADRE